jgi:hypothetical protein
MLEALWSAEFSSNLGAIGGGVVVFETGRVFGGDSQFFYIRTCEVKNDSVRGEVTITHYAGILLSIFGPSNEFRVVRQR